jgi:hypothetical protein
VFASTLGHLQGEIFMKRIRSKYRLPDELVGKTIGIIGTYPGVGKSYIKNDWATKLKLQGFKVFNLGTTHKASVDKTVSALYEYQHEKDENGKRESRERILKEHKKTHAFIFIDEAWIYTQEKIDEVKEKYPHCCFILFGDPLQFEPAMSGKRITELYYCINLNKPYRYSDETLIDAIKQIKSGRIPINFIMQHSVENPEPINEITITYKKDTRDRFNASIKDFHKHGIVKSMKIGWYIDENGKTHQVTDRKAVWRNMDLWEITEIKYGESAELKRLSGGLNITVTWDELYVFFEIHQTVNIHKVQGDTIKEKNILIYLDDFLFNKDRIQDLLRFLYVAISRAENHTQIKFLKSQVEKMKDAPTQGSELSHNLNIDKESNSSELAVIEDVSNFLCQCCGHIDSINIDNNVQVLNSPFLGKVQTKEVDTTRILEPKLFTNKKAQQRYIFSPTGQSYNCNLNIYDDNSNWIIKNPMKKLDNAHPHKHDDLDWNHAHWFCFEFDLKENTHITTDKAQFLTLQKKLIKIIKPYLHHTVFSGNEGYHLWFYVENTPKNIDEYHYLAEYLKQFISETIVDDKYFLQPCSSGKSPTQPMRKPNAIRTLDDGTTAEQTYNDYGMKNVLIANYEMKEEIQAKPTVMPMIETQSYSDKIQFAFNMFKNDHDGTNGNRGALIFSKCKKQIQQFDFTYEEACQLSDLLCNVWNCPEKKNRLRSDLKKIA